MIISYPVSSLLRWWRWLCLLICPTSGKRSAWWGAGRSCQTFFGCWLRWQQSYCPCWRCLRGIGWGRTPSLDVFCGTTASTHSVGSPLEEADRVHHWTLLKNTKQSPSYYFYEWSHWFHDIAPLSHWYSNWIFALIHSKPLCFGWVHAAEWPPEGSSRTLESVMLCGL